MIQTVKTFIIIIMISFFYTKGNAEYKKLAHDYQFIDINGNAINLSEYKNKVIIVINVASQCGFTNQYEDMQKIWEEYEKKGIILIGVPSNNFGKQEPGSNAEIKNFCESKFGVTFLMTEKVNVKGDNAHPFFLWAKKNHGQSAVPKWNFHKILIDKSGKVSETFSSITKPTSSKFIKAIEKLL